MSRVYLSAIAAGAFSLLAMQPAAAGCCNSWGGWDNSFGWNTSWGTGCCASRMVAVQPVMVQPVVIQPAPILVQPAPILVQPAPIVVQQPLIQSYAVNQGPVYSGPGTDYGPSYYQPARPVASYPYVGNDYYGAPAYRPYRKFRSSWSRPYRPYYGAPRAYRASSYHRPAPRYHGAPAAKYYHYKNHK
jgi:hypothetical protein